MKKNNKGFFLAETIVVVALVTTVMAFVYPNVSKLYENYKNRVNYYDQTEDLYVLRAIYSKMTSATLINNSSMSILESVTTDANNPEGCTDVGEKKFENTMESITLTDVGASGMNGLSKLYITGYMSSPSNDIDYNFNKYLKRMKKTTYNPSSYRLIGVFEKIDNDGNVKETRYASIKIDNPNPNRTCNTGGDTNE